MRDSLPGLFWRCIVWAAAPSFSAAEWCFGTLGTALFTVLIEAARTYWEIEVTFPIPSLQGIITFLALCFVIFLFRLLASPFVLWKSDIRASRDAANKMNAKIKTLEENIYELKIDKPDLKGSIDDVAGGGAMKGNDTIVPAILTLTIKNTGRLPTAIEDYEVICLINGRKIDRQFGHIDRPITMNAVVNGELVTRTYTVEDALYNKTSSPLQPGSLVRGFLVVTFDKRYRSTFRNIDYIVKFNDIFGNTYTTKMMPGNSQPGLIYQGSTNIKTVLRGDPL